MLFFSAIQSGDGESFIISILVDTVQDVNWKR
jgi:hypothetical protein